MDRTRKSGVGGMLQTSRRKGPAWCGASEFPSRVQGGFSKVRRPLRGDVPQLKPVSSPPTSTIGRGRRRNAIAPLAIETRCTNYLIKLVKVDNKNDFILIFVKGGETYSTKVPLGTYNIREAAGLSWYGLRDFFGLSTRFSSECGIRTADKRNFTFNRQGNIVHGMKFSLKKVAEGNMEEELISRDEF